MQIYVLECVTVTEESELAPRHSRLRCSVAEINTEAESCGRCGMLGWLDRTYAEDSSLVYAHKYDNLSCN